MSAEVYGKNNKKGNFVPPVIPKSESVRGRILEKLNKNLMFRSLEADNKQILIDAMEERTYRSRSLTSGKENMSSDRAKTGMCCTWWRAAC